MGVTWRHINIAPNMYVWDRLDLIVEGLLSHGATNLTYTFGGTPQWWAKDPNLPNFAPWLGPGSNSAPIDMTHWQAFVLAVADRYRGKIGSYELWNEPQLKDFWGYDDYTVAAEMARIANNAIHSIDTSLKTLSGAVLPRTSSGGMTRGGKYLLALKDKNWPFDIHNAHIYPEIGTTPGKWRTYAEAWQAKLTTLGAPNRPKWVTETNYNLKGGALSDPGIVDYMQRTDEICKDEGIFKVYWYCWNHGDPNLLGIPFTTGSIGSATLASLLAAN